MPYAAPAASTGDYCSLAEIKARLNITAATYDTILAAVITGVSRKIDQHCGRRFYTATETRYYAADVDQKHLNPFSERRFGSILKQTIDDFVSVTQVQVDMNGDRLYEVTLDAAKDYYLEPVNAQLQTPPRPYTTLVVDLVNGQGWYFPPWPKSVAVTGACGFSATTPDEVHEGCLLQVEHLFKRRDAPFGVLSGEAFAYPVKLTMPLDPDVQFLLEDLRSLYKKVPFV